MADHHQRQSERNLEIRQQVEDLRLHGNIKRGNRLVRHQQGRPGDQRPGDGDALALAAGKLMRIARQR